MEELLCKRCNTTMSLNEPDYEPTDYCNNCAHLELEELKDRHGIWDEVDKFLEEFADYKISFGLEYSSIVDWVADFVPRRKHPLARQYNGPFRVSGFSRNEALRKGMEHTRKTINGT